MEPTEGRWRKTACILCSQDCGVEVLLDGRRLARVHGDKAHPISRGYTCEKALRLDHYQNGRDRLTAPLRRRPDGTFEAVDWGTAIREVAAGLARVRDAYGGESIFYYGGGGHGEPPPRRLRSRHARGPRVGVRLERARAGEDGRAVKGRPRLRSRARGGAFYVRDAAGLLTRPSSRGPRVVSDRRYRTLVE